MSAEKEIVNYWYNKRGFFTINNIKADNNRDAGLLALRYEGEKLSEVQHIEIICSVSGNIDTTNIDKTVSKFVEEKFENKAIIKSINSHLKQFSAQSQKTKRVLVLSIIPKSKRKEIINKFKEKEIEIIEFEKVLGSVVEGLDTNYYRNDIIRTLQLVKYSFFSDAKSLAELLVNNLLTSNSRKEFIDAMLQQENVIKNFKMNDEKSIGYVIRNSGFKNPERLAELIENTVLNNKTRKPFLDSLFEQEKMRKLVQKEINSKKETPLNKFFE